MTDKLTKKQEKVLGELYSDLEEMVEDLEALGPVSREFSLVLTKLEEAELWCQRGFEVKGYEPAPEEEEEDEPENADDSEEPEEEGGDK